MAASEVLADEVPVALVYNGISHAVMLATPDDLEDFALGFSLSEGIVDCRTELYDIEVVCHGAGIELRMQLAAAAMHRLKSSRRMRTGKTGCGLCGIESLEQFDQALASVPSGCLVPPSALQLAMHGLSLFQDLHAATGAAHAAGWASANGSVQLIREDVGRHNALDKLIGAMARQGIASHSGFAVVTSRASYEMVQKAARAGMSLLAAVSAPTAMAVRLADAAGLTLAGFVRTQRHVVYTHPYRIAES
ncbi:MAG: formate dehydrogenase accessory sulfurtransferase FdhD [Herminiimonas sp.]|nr:formate dehydrogenase accessory sulfurtransferase FdhD [Herminiimonas sp.]